LTFKLTDVLAETIT